MYRVEITKDFLRKHSMVLGPCGKCGKDAQTSRCVSGYKNGERVEGEPLKYENVCYDCQDAEEAMKKNWRKTANANIRKLPVERAKEIVAAHSRIGATAVGIGDPAIRELTGGFSSQSIDGYVLRRLGVRAGLVKNGN